MVFGTQAVLAVFKRTGGKNWPIRKLTQTRKENIREKERLVQRNVEALKRAAANEPVQGHMTGSAGMAGSPDK